MTTLPEILKALPGLSTKERQQLKAALMFLEQNRASNQNQDFALAALVDFVTSKGLERSSVKVLRNAPQCRSFVEKVAAIEALVKPTNRTAFSTYLRIGFELLHNNLIEMGIVVSSRTLMSQVHRLPAVVDRSFPNYGNRLLLSLLQKHGSNGHQRIE